MSDLDNQTLMMEVRGGITNLLDIFTESVLDEKLLLGHAYLSSPANFHSRADLMLPNTMDDLYHSELSPILKAEVETRARSLSLLPAGNSETCIPSPTYFVTRVKSPLHVDRSDNAFIERNIESDTSSAVPIDEIRTADKSTTNGKRLIRSLGYDTVRCHTVGNQKTELLLNQAVNDTPEHPIDSICNSAPSSANLVFVGSASLAFHQKIKGAAFRRKKNLSISRDSLAANERHHREVVAASKAARQKLQQRPNEEMSTSTGSQKQPNNPETPFVFSARPVPATSRIGGTGGLQGIQKVDKRQPTVPQSPIIGSKRNMESNQTEATNKVMMKTKSLRLVVHGGISGIPKVDKRPTTIASSPLLGNRRKNKSVAKVKLRSVVCETSIHAQNVENDGSNSNRRIKESTTSDKQQTRLKGTPVQTDENDTNRIGDCGGGPFLHSTDRAKRRAEYDKRRRQNEIMTAEEQKSRRRTRIKEAEGELDNLKITI